MDKILVIGGAGFLGHHLIKALLEKGLHVLCLDLQKPAYTHPLLNCIEGSFTDTSILEEALKECKVIFHLASTTLPKSSNENPIFDIDSNLKGTVSLLSQAVQYKVKKFIFISSGGTVYGTPKTVPVSEDHSTQPICSYGIIKLAIEKYLYMYHKVYGLNTCSLRLSNPYGEHQAINKSQGAVGIFCQKAINGENIDIWGDGSVTRDFIHVKDAVYAMICALDTNCAGLNINIGCGEGTSLNSLIQCIENTCNHPVIKKYHPSRVFDVPEIYLDIKLAHSVLDWRPKISLSSGIKELMIHIKNPQSSSQ